VAAQRVHVVDHACSGLDRGTHHLGLGRVDADRQRRLFRESFDHRDHARQFLLQGHVPCARPRGFAAHVKDVGALFRQAHAMGDGRGGRRVVAAVGKRIRRDVDDAHHPGTVELENAAGAVQLRG